MTSDASRWPVVLGGLGFGGLAVAVVLLAVELRSIEARTAVLEARLRGREEDRAVGAAPSGRVGNADVHVAPPALDAGLSERVGEIERRLAIDRGGEGLPAPVAVAPPEERRPPMAPGAEGPPPAGDAVPTDRAAFKEYLKGLEKEIVEEDARKDREAWQGRVVDGLAKAVEMGPQQRDLASQALLDRFREVARLNDLEDQGKITEEEWDKQVYTARKRADDAIRSLLSADQARKFEEWKKRQRWYGLREGGGNG